MRRILTLLFGFSLLLLAGHAHAATITYLQSGTQDTWLTSSSNIANNGLVLSSAVSLTNPGHLYGYCTLNAASWSGTVAVGSAVSAWLLVSTDGGTTYPDGDGSTTPARPPDIVFPLRNVSTAQIVDARVDRMPLGSFKILAKNDGTGVTINGATTAWTVKCKTHTLQVN